MDEDRANGDYVTYQDSKLYTLAVPLHDKDSVVGALMVVQNADYIDSHLREIWNNNLIRLVVQASLLTLGIIFLVRWIIYQFIVNLVELLKFAREGGLEKEPKKFTNLFFFQPILNEVTKCKNSLFEARKVASEEARLRLEKLDTPWTEERLKEFIKINLRNKSIFVVSNREPYIHTKEGNKIKYYVPASGIVTAIEPIMEATGGMWVAHGSGEADKLVVGAEDKIQVPPEEPKYTLKRVWLNPEEEKGFYYGFSNEGLWPLCHIAHTRPVFRKADWVKYQEVNEKFAKTILREVKNIPEPFILIQDFHFALLPELIKAKRPDARIGIFWHIPWPNPESFSICPWRKQLLDGILGADLIGFHIQQHCNNFIDTVRHELEALIDMEQFAVTRKNHVSFIKPFPISIDFSNSHPLEKEFSRGEFLKNLGIKSEFIGLGVDRLDYTKGIIERFKAVEYFLDTNSTFIGKFTFIQIAAPSRSTIESFRLLDERVEKEVERINKKFKANGWKPILLLKRHHSHEEIYKFYKVANFMLVTSLHDGMNLVAKEFISSREDERGVLILSQFAGASRELRDALVINPYNIEQMTEAIHTSLKMSAFEQQKRMHKMREVVKNFNIYRWSAEFLKAMLNIS